MVFFFSDKKFERQIQATLNISQQKLVLENKDTKEYFIMFLCPLATVHYALYHGLAIYTEVTFVNVTLIEAVPSCQRLAVV